MMKKISKIITAILALTLILGAIAVFAAANALPELGMANVAYGDQLTLAFTVTNVDTASGEVAGIAVYENEGDETYKYITFDEKDDNGVKFFESFPIDAKDIDTIYYVAAVSKDADGNIEVGAKHPYSISTYLDAKAEGATANQANLYAKIKAYGAAAKAVLTK